jgi:hypothetical protein
MLSTRTERRNPTMVPNAATASAARLGSESRNIVEADDPLGNRIPVLRYRLVAWNERTNSVDV